jgi:hypothetical protein
MASALWKSFRKFETLEETEDEVSIYLSATWLLLQITRVYTVIPSITATKFRIVHLQADELQVLI